MKHPYIPQRGKVIDKEFLGMPIKVESYRDHYEIWPNMVGGFNLIDTREKAKSKNYRTYVKDTISARLLADQRDGIYDEMIKKLGVTRKEDGEWYYPFDEKEVSNMHWKEYCQKMQNDALYFTDAEQTCILKIAEGTGDNLLKEDIEEGSVDYWNIETLDQCGAEGGGFLMLDHMIAEEDPTVQEIIDKIHKEETMFDDVCMNKMHLISAEDGERLFTELEEMALQRINGDTELEI